MPDTWYKVDNVAKVFLASVTRRDPRVFRVSCTLSEPVDPGLLDAALARTVREYPQFQVTLHRGLFWHYLESSDKHPRAVPETLPPCAAIYGRELKNDLLYRVSYYHDRINVEMFHALSDGNGGMMFLQSLFYNYLQLKYPQALAGVPGGERASEEESGQDSFRQYYTGDAAGQEDPTNRKPVYRMRGLKLPYDQVQFFEGHLSAAQVLAKARGMGVTLTSFLAAAQMLAVYREMPALERSRAVSVSLPVNLRGMFGSTTMRNFFGHVNISVKPSPGDKLENIAAAVKESFASCLNREYFERQIAGNVAIEKITPVRFVPIWIKDLVMRIIFSRSEKNYTITMSNLGRLSLPDAIADRAERFEMHTISVLMGFVVIYQTTLFL